MQGNLQESEGSTKMKRGLNYLTAATLFLGISSCDKSSNQAPPSQSLEKIASTQPTTMRCYFNQNDKIIYDSINRNVLVSFPKNKSEEVIIHGYIKKKTDSFAEVSPIENNEKKRLEDEVRNRGYQGLI